MSALGVSAWPVRAQRLPLEPGAHVRVAPPDSAVVDRWREGQVVAATRIGVLLSGGSFGADTLPLPLDPSIRLQVRRRSPGRLVLGTLGGLVLGVGLGAVVPANTLGSWWGEKTPGHRAEIVYFGLAGAVLGWTASWLLASSQWREVPLAPTGLSQSVVPLNRTAGRRTRFGRRERWTVFPPTEADFAAFFWQHRDSLQAIEGLWERQPVHQEERIAIVRDGRYPEWDYVALWVRRGSEVRDGRIVWALRRRSEPGSYQVHLTDSVGPAYDAYLLNGLLRVRYPGGGIEEWARLELVPRR